LPLLLLLPPGPDPGPDPDISSDEGNSVLSCACGAGLYDELLCFSINEKPSGTFFNEKMNNES